MKKEKKTIQVNSFPFQNDAHGTLSTRVEENHYYREGNLQ
jgi:hypothetical protein